MITQDEQLLKQLIKEILEEQNALAAGSIGATGGMPIGMKPAIFDPERPKKKNRQKKKEN